MSQTIHNISTANSGNGDALRVAFDNQNAMNTELYNDKVNKVMGKDLSSNDFTDTEKTKLLGIEPGAEKNVQPNWLQNDSTQDDYIKNKPQIINTDNKITIQNGFNLAGQDLTINAFWEWVIYGNSFTNTSPVIINIPLCQIGRQRIDYIVPNILNGFDRIAGEEVLSNPIAPQIPNGGIYVTYILVNDSALGTPNTPLLDYSRFLGNYKAGSNQPTLINGIGNNGEYYKVITAGTVDFGNGNITLAVNDYVHYNGYTANWEKLIDNNQSSQENWFESDFIVESDIQDPFRYYMIGSGNNYYNGIGSNFTNEIGNQTILSWFGSASNNGMACHSAASSLKYITNRSFECNFILLKNTNCTGRIGFIQIETSGDRLNPFYGIYLEIINGIGVFKHKNNTLTSTGGLGLSLVLNKNYSLFIVVLSATTSRFILTDLDTNTVVADTAISTNFPVNNYGTAGLCIYETIPNPSQSSSLLQINKMGFGDVKKSQIIKYGL